MAAKRKNRVPVASRGPTGTHGAKTLDERQEYKNHVRRAPGSGETVQDTRPGAEGISTAPDIQGPTVAAGPGDKRRIKPPVSPAAAESPWKRVVSVWSLLGIAGILAIGGTIYKYGRLAERVDNATENVKELGDRTTQNMKELGDRQDKERDRADGFVERLARLEVHVDIAVKSGASTAALAAEVASLRQALGAQQAQDGHLARRIEAVEARLASASTRPTTP